MQVEQFYNKNQFIIIDDENNIKCFQSYNSKIAKMDYTNNILTVYKNWDYSKTTLKHFYLFLNDCVYQVFKLIENSKNKKMDFEKLLNTTQNNIKIIYQNN